MDLNYLKLLNSLCKGWISEYKFHPTRKWRADFANPELKIIIEVEGGIWTKGRHLRGTGYINDMAKYNAANILGYKVLRYTPEQMRAGKFATDLLQIIDKMRKTI